MKPIKIVDKPWGMEIWIAYTDKYVLKIIEFKEGGRSSLQYNNFKSEYIFVDCGRIRIEEEINGVMQTFEYGQSCAIENSP